jgi:glycosyltransferase involved in cell wall biosynthesis
MPVLEAGLVGLPVIATDVPAISEMDFEKAFIFPLDIEPQHLAQQILVRMDASPEHQLRVKVRQNFTWKAIFERDILPLLE